MVYVALLRGINVGGKNIIEMKRLQAVAERAGLQDVRTYINSGNIIFRDDRPAAALVPLLERAIEEEFGFAVKALLRDLDSIVAAARVLPDSWVNDTSMKCDAMFLWEEVDDPSSLERLTIRPELEDVKYVSGTILWRVDRGNVTRSGLMRLAGTELYKKMTVRNCNTLRQLARIMSELDETAAR